MVAYREFCFESCFQCYLNLGSTLKPGSSFSDVQGREDGRVCCGERIHTTAGPAGGGGCVLGVTAPAQGVRALRRATGDVHPGSPNGAQECADSVIYDSKLRARNVAVNTTIRLAFEKSLGQPSDQGNRFSRLLHASSSIPIIRSSGRDQYYQLRLSEIPSLKRSLLKLLTVGAPNAMPARQLWIP